VSKFYIATAQRPIFWLLRMYHLATAHLPIIYLEQIDQLYHHCECFKYLITVHRKIVWQLKIASLEIFRQFIWLLRKAQFFHYCASYNHLVLRISQIFVYFKSTNYFNTGNLLHIRLLYVELLYENFKLPILKYTIFRLPRIIQLFSYWASTNYLSTANRPIISPLEIV
jgi:hypothetical protein